MEDKQAFQLKSKDTLSVTEGRKLTYTHTKTTHHAALDITFKPWR